MPLIKTKYSEMSNAQLAELYNSLVNKDKRIKKFSDRETALRRINQLQQQKKEKEQPMSKPEPKLSLLHKEPKTKAPKAVKEATPAKAKKNSRKINLLTKENPRRAGTAGWHNYNLYKDGMTIEAFKNAGGESNHLNWDLKHNFISLSE